MTGIITSMIISGIFPHRGHGNGFSTSQTRVPLGNCVEVRKMILPRWRHPGHTRPAVDSSNMRKRARNLTGILLTFDSRELFH